VTAIIPTQDNRDSMTVGQGLDLLHANGFSIAGLVAEFERNDFLVHVVLREPGHQILHISKVINSKRVYLLFAGGLERNGVFEPFDVPTVVELAQVFAGLIVAGEFDLAVIA
jgi:hypothetical protein